MGPFLKGEELPLELYTPSFEAKMLGSKFRSHVPAFHGGQ